MKKTTTITIMMQNDLSRSFSLPSFPSFPFLLSFGLALKRSPFPLFSMRIERVDSSVMGWIERVDSSVMEWIERVDLSVMKWIERVDPSVME